MKNSIYLILILVCALQIAPAKNAIYTHDATESVAATTAVATPAMPDLTIQANGFEFVDDKKVNVTVLNNGDAMSITCVMELTVRKIGNASVGRAVKATIVSIPPGQSVKVLVDANNILPKSVKLKDTTFKVVADSAKAIAESNENNNEQWHNMQ